LISQEKIVQEVAAAAAGSSSKIKPDWDKTIKQLHREIWVMRDAGLEKPTMRQICIENGSKSDASKHQINIYVL
jgi:hypothetical protein